MMDMDDALGQENLKTTLIADQGAAVDPPDCKPDGEPGCRYNAGLQSISHGAGAGLESPFCQAYLQKMLAAQLRQEAGRIAHDNVLLKRRTTITGGINSLITGALTAH